MIVPLGVLFMKTLEDERQVVITASKLAVFIDVESISIYYASAPSLYYTDSMKQFNERSPSLWTYKLQLALYLGTTTQLYVTADSTMRSLS